MKSHAEADRALKAAADAASNNFHGLGRGGNVPDAVRPGVPRPAPVPTRGEQPRRGAGEQADDDAAGDGVDVRGGDGAARGGGRQPGRGRGRGRGEGGGGGGQSQRDRLWKDQHKSSVGNHNRKDRAAKKAGML